MADRRFVACSGTVPSALDCAFLSASNVSPSSSPVTSAMVERQLIASRPSISARRNGRGRGIVRSRPFILRVVRHAAGGLLVDATIRGDRRALRVGAGGGAGRDGGNDRAAA